MPTALGGPTSNAGQTISARNATTHGLFSRDVVLPALGEDPEGYKQLEAEWMKQLPPRTLLERHYVEKIAAASWRLRRLHRWQAQILENSQLTEDEQLDKLAKVLRHETTLHRQIDTSVRMLSKDAPELYARRATEEVLAETRTAPREYHLSEEDAVHIELKVQDKLYQVRQATEAATITLADAPLDGTKCENEPAPEYKSGAVFCENELGRQTFVLVPDKKTPIAETPAPRQALRSPNCRLERL